MGKEEKIRRTKKVLLTEEELLEEKKTYLRSITTTYNQVCFHIPFIPPSVNDLYFNNRRTGGRSLTTEGGVFKLRVKDYLISTYLDVIQTINPRSIFELKMRFYLSGVDLFTKNYLIDKKTQSPFKKRDLGNMEKILVDCIKEFCMKDDCQVFVEELSKHPYIKNKPGVDIYLREINPIEITTDVNLIYNLTRYREDVVTED